MPKPFDLKAALSGEPVRCDSGNTVDYVFERLINRGWSDSPALQFTGVGDFAQCKFVSDLDGKSTATELLLYMAPRKVKKTVWVNLWNSGDGFWYRDEESARRIATENNYYHEKHYLATAVPVEIEVEE